MWSRLLLACPNGVPVPPWTRSWFPTRSAEKYKIFSSLIFYFSSTFAVTKRVSSQNEISTKIHILRCAYHTFALGEDNSTAKFHKERSRIFVFRQEKPS
jgi:hypothetical protein